MENFLTSSSNKILVISSLLGLILIGVGFLYFKGIGLPGTKIEVLDEKVSDTSGKIITVEIAGQVVRPGVYKLTEGSRIDDLLIVSGGFSENADRSWTDKFLNRASKLLDGQKIYVPKVGEQTLGASANNGVGYQSGSSTISSDSKSLIDINSASLDQLDSLPGIGPTYGKNIIDHRPYSKVEELLSRGVLKSSVYEKIKTLVTVY